MTTCQMAFVSRMASITSSPAESRTATENRCRVHIEPNILGVIHEGAPCCRR